MLSIWTGAASDFAEFFVLLRKKTMEKGVDEEVFGRQLKNGVTVGLMADAIVAQAGLVNKITLRNCSKTEDEIMMHTFPFAGNGFFRENGSVRLRFLDNFKNWILGGMESTNPSFLGKIQRIRLITDVLNSEILNGSEALHPFTIMEFASVIHCLIFEQPVGLRKKFLLEDGQANVFIIRLPRSRIVSVSVYRDVELGEWCFDAFDLDSISHPAGSYAFTHKMV